LTKLAEGNTYVNSSAQDWDDRYAAAELVWSKGPNVFVEEFAEDLPAGRALDVAGGEGRNALWLAERGWDATVVDFSQVALSRAVQLWEQRPDPAHAAGGQVRVKVVDLLVDDVGYREYDLVLVCYLQLPPSQRRLALQSAARAVAPGGALLVVAHHSDNLSDGVGGPQDPTVLYSQADVEADLDGTDMAVRRAERVSRAVATPEGERVAWDALVVAVRP
jgi:SAM-dependent methyltransferase